MACADLWVYNAENFCVSCFDQVASIFHLGGGNKKNYLGPTFSPAHLEPELELFGVDVDNDDFSHHHLAPPRR